MWEKFKNSKFVTKMKNAGSSRAVYVTVVTLLLAVAVLITATAIANRAKKNSANAIQPPSDGVSDGGGQDSGSTQPPADEDTNQTPSDTDTGNSQGDQDATPTAKIPELSLPVSGTISKHHDNTFVFTIIS